MNTFRGDDGEAMPPELMELDRELRSIRFEERPSFAPELRAELASLDPAPMRRGGRFRLPLRMAAALVLVTGTVAVPSARASISGFWTRIQEELAPEAPPRTPLPTSFEFLDRAAENPVFVPLPIGDATVDAEEPAPEAPWSGDLSAITPMDAYPELLDRDGIDDLVRWFYPDRLEEAGVGGVLRLILWVEGDGSVSDPQVVRSSGIPELDEAALRAAEHFRFKPALRRGQPVGTWVEFDVNVQSEAPDA